MKYEYLYSGMEGSYWIDCEVLSSSGENRKIKFEHPFWDGNFFNIETTSDRIRIKNGREK